MMNQDTSIAPQGKTLQGFHPVLERLFLNRNYSSDDVAEFLSWDLKSLPDLTSLNDMDKAANRIIHGIKNKERVGIYGDYDVDGTTSCALFFHFFRLFGVSVDLFQPGRFVEGYGLHESSINLALEKGVDLLITVDCGITNNEAADFALKKNLDLIITDHHKDGREEMPKAYAVVNPNRRDEPEHSPLRVLAGVGVAFALCLKIKKLWDGTPACPSIYPLLQFVAVGTLCDMAHLSPMNIKLVRHGLKQMRDSPFPGLEIFLTQERNQGGEKNKPHFVPSETVSFLIGPMINSKGRLEHPERALNLLIATENTDYKDIRENYLQLEISNKERKFIQAKVLEKAFLKCQENKSEFINIVYDRDWHEGVIGIVASRLVEAYKVPTVVLTKSSDGGILKASVRTAGVLDIFQHLKLCEDLFLKFGGHAAAAGFSMKEENLEAFIRRMNEGLKNIPAELRMTQKLYDGEISFTEVEPGLVRQLNLLEPFGRGNKKPLFKMSGLRLHNFTIMKEVHVRWEFARIGQDHRQEILRGISFNYQGSKGSLGKNRISPEVLMEEQKKYNKDLSILFTLGINVWNGKEYLQLMVDSISLHPLQ